MRWTAGCSRHRPTRAQELLLAQFWQIYSGFSAWLIHGLTRFKPILSGTIFNINSNVFNRFNSYVKGSSRYETCGIRQKWRADKNPKMLQ